MKRKLLAVLLAIPVLAGAALGWVSWKASRKVEAPYPAIRADMSPEAVGRGEAIFSAVCQECHRHPDAERASGKRMEDVPAFLGTFHSANLTSHPTAGIGAARDEELARVIRYGVSRDGRRTIMGSSMGDADIAAVLGFLRSNDARLAPDPTVQPPTRLSLMGKVIFVTTGLTDVPDLPATGIPVPPKSDALAYGHYMAHAVLHCGECHTGGFAPDKAEGPDAFAGGLEFEVPGSGPLLSPNITFHETGLKGWTEEQFARALREGFRPDGTVITYPMPRFRGVDDQEVHALYSYLKSVPPRPSKAGPSKRQTPAPERAERLPEPVTPPSVAPSTPTAPVQAKAAAPDAEHLFGKHGCATCHEPGAPFHGRLVAARGKTEEAVAQWIRTPQLFKPGTQMPTYANQLSEEHARVLARWILAGNPKDATEARGRRAPN